MPSWFQQATNDPAPEGHTVSTAINPNAANIRAALKAVGLEDAVLRVITSTRRVMLYVSDSPATVAAVQKALKPLWSDSEDRISREYGRAVEVKGELLNAAMIGIDRSGWSMTTPTEFDQERRARALFGPEHDTTGYPLQYLPRRKGDHEPWAANGRTEIRYSNAQVEEWQPVRDPQAAQDAAKQEDALYVAPAPSLNQYIDSISHEAAGRATVEDYAAAATALAGHGLGGGRLPRTEDSERQFRTKPGEHAIGRLVARSKCRRNRRR